MKIITGRVDWETHCDNTPHLELLVDRIPPTSELRYTKTPAADGHIYYAEQDGYVNFHFYARPGRGCGGAIYTLTMTDGTQEKLLGPWSSRAGAVNTLGLGPVIDVSLIDKPKSYERGWTFYAGACTLELVESNIDKIDIGLEYARLNRYNEPWEGTEVTFPKGSGLLMLPTISISGFCGNDLTYVPVVQYPNGDIWSKSLSTIDNHENWLEWKGNESTV